MRESDKLGGPKTKGMGVEHKTKVGIRDALGGLKTKGMGVEQQNQSGDSRPTALVLRWTGPGRVAN